MCRDHWLICNFYVGINIFNGDFNSVLSVLTFELDRAMNWFNFSDFQYRLLREFSLILAGNIFLVLVAWKVYGPRISARFLAKAFILVYSLYDDYEFFYGYIFKLNV